jgi:hypothetical protein
LLDRAGDSLGPFEHSRADCVANTGEIGSYVDIPRSQDQDTIFAKPGSTPGVSLSAVVVAVATAIYLDGDAQAGAVEVQDIWSGRMLATEALALYLASAKH